MAKLDPLNYVSTNRFYIEIDSQLTAAFSECSGLEVQVEKEVFQEGGLNHQQRIFLKHTTFGDLTLKRGITNDPDFWDWIQESLMGGGGRRRHINILVFNQAGETMQVWRLLGAVPIAWKTPALNADSSNLALEELVLAYEGLDVKHKQGSAKLQSGGAKDKKVFRDQQGFFLE
jgi:phage tail-like protein